MGGELHGAVARAEPRSGHVHVGQRGQPDPHRVLLRGGLGPQARGAGTAAGEEGQVSGGGGGPGEWAGRRVR